MMFGPVGRAWGWLVDGLVDAAAWMLDRFTRRDAYRVECDEAAISVTTPSGEALGRCVEDAGTTRVEPPDLARRLMGQSIDIVIPPAWLFRRDLDPVAAQSAPYLDAFVRHQIDRITPWRVADVHYHVRHAPLPSDPTRLSVEVGVVPKRFVRPLVDALERLRPKRLRLLTSTPDGSPGYAIPLGDPAAQRNPRVRQFVALGLAAILLVLPGSVAWIWWQVGAVQGEIDDADRVIDERKAVLAAAARHDRAGTTADEALRRLRDAQPKSVDVLEALSAALPDDAYLTELTIEKDHVRISGVSTDTQHLVPALETSRRFADAASFAATTRVETGQGDRFNIEMRTAGPPTGTSP